MTEAVIFDLDGSLVDSMWMWRAIDSASSCRKICRHASRV